MFSNTPLAWRCCFILAAFQVGTSRTQRGNAPTEVRRSSDSEINVVTPATPTAANSLHQGIYLRLFAIHDQILQILPRICKFPFQQGLNRDSPRLRRKTQISLDLAPVRLSFGKRSGNCAGI